MFLYGKDRKKEEHAVKILFYDTKSYDKESFEAKAKDYPDHANSDAYRIGKARYKDHDEEKAAAFEKQYGGEEKEISFDLMNCLINYEVQEIIEQMEKILR